MPLLCGALWDIPLALVLLFDGLCPPPPPHPKFVFYVDGLVLIMAWDFVPFWVHVCIWYNILLKLPLFWNCGSVVKLPHDTCHETIPLFMWSSYHRGDSEV